MNNKLVKGILSCAMAAALVSTGAAQAVSAEQQSLCTEDADFDSCVETIRSIYTERYPEQAEIVNSVIDELTSDEVFWECYEYEGKTAFRILEDTLMDALTPTVETYGFSGGAYYTAYAVPAIKQITNYNCGPASVQMALIGSGKPTDTNDTKQTEIAQKIGTTEDYGTNINKITEYMQDNGFPATAFSTYRTKGFTTSSKNKVIQYLTLALQCNTVPIIRVSDTSTFKYYNNTAGSVHYVVIRKIDPLTQTITVVDPHYDSRFFGEHTITYDELFNNANTKSDLWISVYTYDTLKDEEYIY